MSLARTLQQLRESDLPRNKEQDILEKSAAIQAIHDELQHIEETYLHQTPGDEKTFLQLSIELYRCNELVTIFEEYLKSGKKAQEPEYQHLAKKLDDTKQKSLTIRALLFPLKHTNKTPPTHTSENKRTTASPDSSPQ